MNNVGLMRFGAVMLKDLRQQPAKTGRASVTLDLYLESSSDLKYSNLPGLQKGTPLAQWQYWQGKGPQTKFFGPVSLTFQRNDKDELTLQSQYTVVEDYQAQEARYRLGQGMFSLDDEPIQIFDHYETVTKQRLAPKTGNLAVKSFDVFRDIFDLMDNAWMPLELLRKGAIKPVKEAPKLGAVFAQLGAGNDMIKKLLLDNMDQQPALQKALSEDAPVLKETLLHPVFSLLTEQGKKLAGEIQDAAAKASRQQDEAAAAAKASIATVARRITGS